VVLVGYPSALVPTHQTNKWRCRRGPSPPPHMSSTTVRGVISGPTHNSCTLADNVDIVDFGGKACAQHIMRLRDDPCACKSFLAASLSNEIQIYDWMCTLEQEVTPCPAPRDLQKLLVFCRSRAYGPDRCQLGPCSSFSTDISPSST
jgi:hypothetical protein